jgi:hypothetical protein
MNIINAAWSLGFIPLLFSRRIMDYINVFQERILETWIVSHILID